MNDNTPNSDEGASSVDDIKKQNPTGTTTGDQTGESDDGVHKVDGLAKAGRDGMDTDDDQVAEGKWKSTSDGSGTSETD